MRNFLTVLAALLLGTTSAIANDAALGLWKSEPGETGGYIHVQITNCGEKLCGEIIDDQTLGLGPSNRCRTANFLL